MKVNEVNDAQRISRRHHSLDTPFSDDDKNSLLDVIADGKTEDPDKLYKRRMAVDSKTKMRKEEYVDEAKVDAGKTPYEKETARNKRNTPAGGNPKFDRSVFITRKSGESLDSARGRKRREAHAKRRGVKQEGYQRNPEKGEAEERKAEKRRKESGRMPPRGDKRREDFERWYAANVR